MIANPPYILLLEAVKADLDGADWLGETGLPTVHRRHQRHRLLDQQERPGIEVVFVDDDAVDDQALQLNAWEQQRAMTIDLSADADLEPEDSGQDPTGWLRLSRICATGFSAIKRDGSATRRLADYVSLRSVNPSEESDPDQGRLAYTLVVLYRVRSDDENVLLAEGVNA